MTSDNGIGSMAEAISEEADADNTPETDPIDKWPSALVALFAARLAIVSAEGKIAAAVALRKFVLVAVATTGTLLSWVVLNAALMGLIADITELRWYHIALILSGLHLIVAILGAMLLTRKTISTFPITRSEFIKDQQWLSNVKNQSTTKN